MRKKSLTTTSQATTKPSAAKSSTNPPADQKSTTKKSSGTVRKTIAALLYAGAALIFAQIVVLLPLNLLADYVSATLLQTIYSALAYALACFLIIYVGQKLVKIWKTDREELGLRGLPTWTDLGLAPVAFIIYLFAAAGLTALFAQIFPWFDLSETQDVGYNYLNSGVDKVIAFAALCIFAPVGEELIFRGWLYGKLRSYIKLKSPKNQGLRTFLNILIPATLVSLLFGLLHGQWNVGVNVFAMSLVLCGLREITGTIYSGILLHAIKNTIAFALLFLFR